MKKDIKNLRASVRAKLLNKARESGRPFSEVLQYYAMERFLGGPLAAIAKSQKFDKSWKCPGQWK